MTVVRMPARTPPVTWLSTAEIFSALEATPWVSRGLMLGPGRPMLLAGYGASAKTLAAQSLALAVASGRPVWDHFDVAAPAVVSHMDYEQGAKATRRRYQRLALGHGIAPPELADRLRLAPLPDLFLDTPGAADAYARELEGAALVIVDSLRAAAPSRDENASDVRSMIDVLTHVSEKTGCSVLIIHHAGKRQDRHADARQVARGSSAIFDACGNVLVIEQGRTKTDPRRVHQTKTPAEAEGAPLEDFELEVEDVAVGSDRSAGVRVAYRPVEEHDPQASAGAEYERDAERLVGVVRAMPGATTNQIITRAGMGRTRAVQMLAALADDGRLHVTPAARGARAYYVTTQDPPWVCERGAHA